MKTILKFINPAFAALVLACFGVLPIAKGTPDPAAVTGATNTADGNGVLLNITTGTNNSGFGFNALQDLTSGVHNTGIGESALANITTATQNTGVGAHALLSNIFGANNTAVGFDSLRQQTIGTQNTAIGVEALRNNSNSNNTATGYRALFLNTTGNFNTADGVGALRNNVNGADNTAVGVNALFFNNSSFNTAVGFDALLNVNGNSNVGIGVNAGKNLTVGTGNVCIGVNVNGVAGESNTTRIKNIFSSVASQRAVFVNSDNKVGTLASSRRYKEEIKPMEKASETLFALKPVTFRYKKEVDSAQALSFGLIAEDVAKVDSDLITRDEEGKPETVRYEAVNAMLLNEFLKEHRKLEELKSDFQATVAQQQKEIQALTATVKEQAAQIQKVSDKVELSKPAPRTVLNNQ
jgi:hypothetical protein